MRKNHPAVALLGSVATLLVAAIGVGACTTEVGGTPVAVNGGVPLPTESQAKRHTSIPSSAPDGSAAVEDPVDDECLLTDKEFSALTGKNIDPGEQKTVKYPTGDQNSCRYSTPGSPGPDGGRIDVMAFVNGKSPGEMLRSKVSDPKFAGNHPLDGVGAFAMVVPSPGHGTDLYIAGQTFLIDLFVNKSTSPTDDQWRSAGKSALKELEG